MPANEPGAVFVERIARNLRSVEERIHGAAARVGRDPTGVRLVVVTKTMPVGVFEVLARLGVTDVGENRVGALVERRARAGAFLRWHMIGHVQRNKVPELVPTADLIHSVDSLRLATRIAEVAARSDRRVDVLLEVNVSGEGSKTGNEPAALPGVLDEILGLERLRVRGLMAMAPLSDSPETSRPVFRELARIHSSERARVGADRLGPELSMGMTQDFEVAVEEGATMLRVGTACFEGALEEAP